MEKKYARGEIVYTGITHVNRDVVLVRKGVGHVFHVFVLCEDTFSHFIQGCLKRSQMGS